MGEKREVVVTKGVGVGATLLRVVESLRKTLDKDINAPVRDVEGASDKA